MTDVVPIFVALKPSLLHQTISELLMQELQILEWN